MNESRDNEIVHRWQGGQSMRAIARELGVSRWYVKRVIGAHQAARDVDSGTPPIANLPKVTTGRSSKVDPFESRIVQLLERYPKMTATRIFEELKPLGYEGSYTILRERVKQLRPQPTKPLVVRFETVPGAQAQMDWAVYDIDFTQEGRRRVNLFSYVLGYSRRQYVCFTERQDFDATIRQHIQAFEHLQGVAATCLYDNMKVVVTRWEDEQPIYNTRFLAFATHYGYRPWACRPRRPETKGKVERPFHYVETSLLMVAPFVAGTPERSHAVVAGERGGRARPSHDEETARGCTRRRAATSLAATGSSLRHRAGGLSNRGWRRDHRVR